MNFNPVKLEILNNQLASIAEEMGQALMRSAFSANIKERRDFSCAIFDRNGNMLAQAAHIPVHLGSAPLSVKAIIAACDLGQEDHGIVNDPYCGGTHLPDITVVSPVMAPGQESPAFYVATRAHHADVGGAQPGSMPLVTTLAEEGFCIAPQRFTDDVLTQLQSASRTPNERRGDMLAQLAANRVGQKRLAEWLRERGFAQAEAETQALLDWSRRMMMDVLNRFPQTTVSAVDWLDGDGLGAVEIPICVKLSVLPEKIVVDFSESAHQVRGPLNAVRAITVSAVHYVFRCLAPPELPQNDGFMSLIDVVTIPGTIVDATFPAAVSAGNVETSQRIVDVLFAAVSKVYPDAAAAAACGSMNNVLVGGETATGHPYVYYETIGGGMGATPHCDGASAIQTHMTNTLNTPVEAFENLFPIRIERYEVRRGSGGAGLRRGGDGLIRSFRFLRDATITVIAERRQLGPPGCLGGKSGQPGVDKLEHSDGTTEILAGKAVRLVRSGSRLTIETPGGGGFGAPDRSP